MVCGYHLAMRIVRSDIIICGAGLAGLSLLYRAMKAGIWNDLQITVIDRSDKQENDRTWSFWKTEDTGFGELIFKSWNKLVFYSNSNERLPLEARNYSYNAIRSIDFYTAVLTYLRQFANITFVKSDILQVLSLEGECRVLTNTETYIGRYLFNSIYKKPALKKGEQYFLQHFKGLRISCKYEKPLVDEAYLMDFRTSQLHGTTFFYTLPFAADELFVEYTLFSQSLLTEKEYDQQLQAYISGVLKISNYKILEEECGVIPMTDYQFRRFDGNMVYIGSAGGDTRASTGYTFTNVQKTVTKIIAAWQSTGTPFFTAETVGIKQQLYDSTLLEVLAAGEYPGHQLFRDLFKRTRASTVFAFLDAETSFLQDISIMKSLRVWPFLRAFAGAVKKRAARKS